MATKTETSVTEIDRAQAAQYVREAICYMVMMWDALREAEAILGDEIESDQISPLAGNCNTPEDAHGIPDADIWEVLGNA